jgi:hypothetical protein
MFAKFVVIVAAFIVATTLLPGAHAAMYVNWSTTPGATCENQFGFRATAVSTEGTGCNNAGVGGPFRVGGTAIDDMVKYTEDLCISDSVMMVSDAGCNEVHRAAHICVEKEWRVVLYSCNDDIEVGTHGMELIK